jgi:DNA-binding PadR family transcriptional regulator
LGLDTEYQIVKVLKQFDKPTSVAQLHPKIPVMLPSLYINLNELIEEGCVTVERVKKRKDRQWHNVYSLTEKGKHFFEKKSNNLKAENE